MKKLLIALALCTALSACKKDEPAAPTTTGAETPAAAPAAPEANAPAPAAPAETTPPATDPAVAPGDAATASTALPPACEEYFKRAEACFTQAGAAGEAMKSAFEQSRQQMATMPAAQMEAGCKAANDAFAQTAAAMNCK